MNTKETNEDPVLQGIKDIGVRVDEYRSQMQDFEKQLNFIEENQKKTPIALDGSIDGQLAKSIKSNVNKLVELKEGTVNKVQFKALPMASTTHLDAGIVTYGKFTGDKTLSANVRDIIPSVTSDTALWAGYVEGSVTGAAAKQVEGTDKAPIEFTYEQVTVTAEYIAAFTSFSKQLSNNIPFLTNVLPQQLRREFLKSENAILYAALSAAATGVEGTGATKIERVINTIALRLEAGFESHAVLVNFATYASLLNDLYATSNYNGSGAVVGNPDGFISIWTVPIVPVSWTPANTAVFIDRSFMHRVVTDPLNIQFSEHHSDYFQKNLIAARIEEMEGLAIMKPAAISVVDLTIV